jgi:hypothetical protein
MQGRFERLAYPKLMSVAEPRLVSIVESWLVSVVESWLVSIAEPLKKLVFVIVLMFCVILTAAAAAQKININMEFFDRFQEISPVKRNFFLDSLLNSDLSGKGIIESINISERYGRRFRIIIKENEAIGISVLYYVYTNNEAYQTKLKKGVQFSFSGRFITYTPLSSERGAYVFDIVLSE